MEHVLPFNKAAEEAVLGSLILHPPNLTEVEQHLKPGDFYLSQNREIYQAVLNLAAGNEPVDVVTVSAELKRIGSTVEDWQVVDLVTIPENAYNVSGYVKTVKGDSMRRKLTEIGLRLANQGRNAEDPYKLLSDASNYLTQISADAVNDPSVTMPESIDALLTDIMHRVEDRQEGVHYRGVVPTGFRDLDRFIDGGFERGTLNYFGAVAKMGKSAFMLSLARNMARAGKRVLIFSLEMSHKQLNRRNLSSLTGIPISNLKTGDLSDMQIDEIYKTSARMQKLPVVIDDSAKLTPSVLRQRMNYHRANGFDFDIVFIDYLQLIGSDDKRHNEREIIDTASSELRVMAKEEFNRPFVVPAQLVQKKIEDRHEKRPQASDFFGSSQPIKDGHLLGFLFRESVYDDLAEENVFEVIIRGNRDGRTGTVKLFFDPATGLMGDLDKEQVQL